MAPVEPPDGLSANDDTDGVAGCAALLVLAHVVAIDQIDLPLLAAGYEQMRGRPRLVREHHNAARREIQILVV